VEDNRDYKVVLNEFMLNGGDGYTMFQQARNRVQLGGEVSYVKKALQQMPAGSAISWMTG
jgi:2',3'-cyclic-nucleotide 2'-phosphodiesterase (5'-nucleotidase family)